MIEQESFNPEYDAAMEAASFEAGYKLDDINEALYQLNRVLESANTELARRAENAAKKAFTGGRGTIIPKKEGAGSGYSEASEKLIENIARLEKHIKVLSGK